MTDKVMILRYTYFSDGTGALGITAECMLATLGKTYEATAYAVNVDPPGGWKPLLKSAAISQALQLFPDDVHAVDSVVFPDLTVL